MRSFLNFKSLANLYLFLTAIPAIAAQTQTPPKQLILVPALPEEPVEVAAEDMLLNHQPPTPPQ